MRTHPYLWAIACAGAAALLAMFIPPMGEIGFGLVVLGLVGGLFAAVVFSLVWTIRRFRAIQRPTSRAPLRIAGRMIALGVVVLAATNIRVPPAIPAAPLVPSDELAYLEKTDQEDRRAVRLFTVTGRDRLRRTRVLALHEKGLIATPQDHYSAALVLQHGTVPADYQLANELATVARNGGVPAADWLTKATYDRWMRSMGKPQIYDTQTGFSFQIGK